MGAGLASEALSEADAALGVLDGIGGQSTRKAELLLVAARAARNAVRPLSRTGSAGRPAAAPALRRSGAPALHLRQLRSWLLCDGVRASRTARQQ
jgi:hypothetical protein